MAEFGAHLTSAGNEGASVPSIFEVLAQENLMSSLRPALKYTCKVLAENHPEKFAWLHRSSDEVYTFLDVILQSYYLKHHNGSFAENFYGLKRVPLMDPDARRLTRSTRLKSLLFLVMLPYVKNKADSMYENRETDASAITQEDWLSRLYRAFLQLYPAVHLMYQVTLFTCQLLYVCGKLRSHSPWLPLAGVELQNLSLEDIMQQNDMSSLKWDWRKQSLLGNLGHAVKRGGSLVALTLSSGLSVGVFFLQFLEWWYASEHNNAAVTSLPVPPPPAKVTVEGLPSLSSICPLCQRIRSNDTVLAVTGFVFCYPCIYRHLQTHHKCPVTGYPATSEHLVKLYLPET